jgi:hypothetical protein
VPECNHFFSAARSFLAGPLIPTESAASLSSLPFLPSRCVWYGICTSHRVGSKGKRKWELGKPKKAHRRLAKSFYFFPFCLAPLPTQGDFMKNLRSVLFALTVLLLATAAQAQTTNVKAKIPFDFVVGNQSYSAGEYTLKSLVLNSAAIRIDNADESEKGITLANVCRNLKPADGTTLVFERLGDNYFLYQIWTDGSNTGREFRMSKTEVLLAKNHSKPELVIVAANISH